MITKKDIEKKLGVAIKGKIKYRYAFTATTDMTVEININELVDAMNKEQRELDVDTLLYEIRQNGKVTFENCNCSEIDGGGKLEIGKVELDCDTL